MKLNLKYLVVGFVFGVLVYGDIASDVVNLGHNISEEKNASTTVESPVPSSTPAASNHDFKKVSSFIFRPNCTIHS